MPMDLTDISRNSPRVAESDLDRAIFVVLALPAREPETPESRNALREMFRESISDLPPEWIGKGLISIARGGLGHAFRPSPPELRLYIDGLMKPPPPPVDPRRAERAAAFDAGAQPLPGADFAASFDDIERQIDRMLAAMHKPRGFDVDAQRDEYVRTLRGLKLGVLIGLVDRIIDGSFERKTPTTMPRPAELGILARKLRTENDKATSRTAQANGTMYRFKVPRSKILEHDISRERCRELVDNGTHPRGCIWIPGPKEAGDNGTMYAPDPDWQLPVPV